jgi:hypothetical protein
MSAAEIPNVPSSILKRKSNVGRAIDTTRHTMETRTKEDVTATPSIVKRAKIPSTKALVPVPVHSQKRYDFTGKVYADEDDFADEAERHYSGKQYDKYWRDHPGELAKFDQENYENNTVAKYAFNVHPGKFQLKREMHSNLKNRKKYKRNHKTWFPDDRPIYDAKYTEVDDVHQLESPKKKEFGKAPARDARNMGIAKKSKSEPSSIAAISKSKERIKQSLIKRPDKQVSATEAFDYVVDQFTVKNKSLKEGQTEPKKNHSLKSNIVRGIKDVNEVCEEIGKNPNLQRIKVQHEADLRHMASAGRRVRGSIIAGNNRRQLRYPLQIVW